jgi:hypothetical protein
MSLYDRITEEAPSRSGAVAVSLKSKKKPPPAGCKKPVPCHDRLRSRYRPDSPTDKQRSTARRMSDLASSLRSALLCRDRQNVQKYINLVAKALGDIRTAVTSKKSMQAFDAEDYIKCRHAKKTEDRLPGGKGDKLKPSDVNAAELRRGIAVELEHTKDRALAQEIALDHLAEDPRYYTKLKKVHREQADFPSKYPSVAAGSNRSGVGTAPLPDPRAKLENWPKRARRSKKRS